MKLRRKNPKREPIHVVAIIPARGGKQSIRYKNLQVLSGKTLLAWAVDVGFEAKRVDAVIVSTEDARIAREANGLGARVAPRPEKYSQPTSGDAGFYHHAVVWMEKEFGWKPDLIVNLRPTSPLRFASDIDAMVTYMLRNPIVDGLKSVIPTPLHPYKMWLIHPPASPREAGGRSGDKGGRRGVGVGSAIKLTPLKDFQTSFRKKHGPDQPRQEVQKQFPVYFQDGQIDITRRRFILRPECLKNDNVWGKDLHGYVLDPRTSTDLDEPADFVRAERLYRKLKKEKGKMINDPST